MEIKEHNNPDRQNWNSFVLANQGEFLQSWEWGDFQKSFGKKIWRLTMEDNGEILGIALVIKHSLPFGKNYLYLPKGPIFKNPKIQNLFFNKIKEIAKKESSVFARIEPSKNTIIPPGENVLQAANLQPRTTLILDIAKPKEQLLAEMKPKTRYNIKLAEKHGVRTSISDKKTLADDFEKFWLLMSETARRDGFRTHPKNYYWQMLNILKSGKNDFRNSPVAELFLAECQSEILAANIVIFFGSRATYLHGASSSGNRNLMTPYLLQWEQIKKARKQGIKEYDFWGITIKTQNPKPPPKNFSMTHYKPSWEGITRFKKGFGGKEIVYPEAIDFIYQPTPYKAIKALKKLKATVI